VTRLLPISDNILFSPILFFVFSYSNECYDTEEETSVTSKKLVPIVEHNYVQCKEVHPGYGHSRECFLLGIGCQYAKDINKDLLG
jgi:hypothetical protein